jgi:hypothetical protein
MGWVVSVKPRPRFSRGVKDLRFLLDRGWVGLRDGQDTEARGKILCLCRDRTAITQSVIRLYTDWTTPAPVCILSAPNIITTIKLWKMKWSQYGVRTPDGQRPRGRLRRWWEEDINKDVRGIGWQTGFMWLVVRAVSRSCEHDNEYSGCITDREFAD